MPQFTQTFINQNSRERNERNLQNLINSANQFAGVMYNIQQAKQAELVKEITVKSSIISALPKNLQLKAAENILLPIVNKAYPNFKIDKSLFNQQGVDNFTKFVEGAKKIENPVDRQTYWATGMDMFSDPQQKAIEQIEKSIAQDNLAKNVKILQGQPITTVSPFQTALPQGTPGVLPSFAGEGERTTIPTPQSQIDALNTVALSEEGRKVKEFLFPKPEKAQAIEYWKNSKTGEIVKVDSTTPIPQGENWFKVGTGPTKETANIKVLFDPKSGRSYSFDLNDPDQKEQYFDLQKLGLEPDRRPKPEKPEKEFKESDYRAYMSQARRYAMDLMGKGNAITNILSTAGSLENALSQIEQGMTSQQKATYKGHLKEYLEGYASDAILQEFERREGRIKQPKINIVDYFKRAKTKEDAIGRIKSAIKQGWTKEQLQKAERQAGWAW